MESRSFAYKYLFLTLIAAKFICGCIDPQKPIPQITAIADPNSSKKTTTTTSSSGSTGSNAMGVKIIFNKKSFFNNTEPNALGCAGDAKQYYDPLTDFQVSSKPIWLKNVSVDLTNSNSLDGPSKTIGCILTGNDSPPAANCASFDDLQPLDGRTSRSILVGGFGCTDAGSTCSPDSALGDIWILGTKSSSSLSTWAKQSVSTPILTTQTKTGILWAGGDFDVLHNHFYIYGGVAPNSATTNTLSFSNKPIRIILNEDGTVSTIVPPAELSSTVSSKTAYGNWITDSMNAVLTAPPALTGPTFTYASRRDPTSKSWCNKSSGCSDVTGVTLNSAIARNEHHDYFLLVGGFRTTGFFSDLIYLYKPHGFSNDAPLSISSGGDWNLVSNGSTAPANTTIMSVVSVSSQSSQGVPYTVTSSTFDGRGYHRTVYDPNMNRFYIYGGLKNTSATTALASAGAPLAPTATDELWIYDPPALGRRPTGSCFTSKTPDGTSLPVSSGSLSGGSRYNLNVNQAYMSQRMVFPPGGCLQKAAITNPTARFEHSMAFDPDHNIMLLFGGGSQTSTVFGDGNSLGGDPTRNANSISSLFNDTWIYLPPTTTEYYPFDYTTTTAPHPFNSTNPFQNIFGIDFWTRFLTSDSNHDPTSDEALGVWIKLTHTLKPTARLSAPISYDRSRNRFYLQGGFGCTDSSCTLGPQHLNDLWEFTPPDITKSCDRTNGTCSDYGFWTKIRTSTNTSISQPTIRKGSLMAAAQPMFSHADTFYTVTDTACAGQGPSASNDASVSKQNVGAIYIDLDRTQMGSAENLLINLRLLPFDKDTKLAGWQDNLTDDAPADDYDKASTTDQAIIRVQLMQSPFKFVEQIQALHQPRYHDYLSGSLVTADTLMYVSGPTGQILEKQILVPLSSVGGTSLVKIERISGSVKFYEMNLTKF